MLFVQFRCLTFTCGVCNSFGSPVGRRHSGRRSPVRSSPEVVIITPLPPRIRQGSRCGARSVGRRFSGIFFRVCAQPRAEQVHGEEDGGARSPGFPVTKSLTPDRMIGRSTGWFISMRPESPAAAWGSDKSPILRSDSLPPKVKEGGGGGNSQRGALPADTTRSRRKMMGFLRRTFSRRFATRERVERDSNGGAGAGGVTGNPLLLPHQQQVVHAPAVVTGGGSAHIQAAGTARSSITCRVLLLDGRDLQVDLPVSDTSGHFGFLSPPREGVTLLTLWS